MVAFEGRGTLTRPPVVAVLVWWVVFLVGLGASQRFGQPALARNLASAVYLLGGALYFLATTRRRGVLRLDDAGLSVDGKVFATPARLRQAVLARDGMTARVLLDRAERWGVALAARAQTGAFVEAVAAAVRRADDARARADGVSMRAGTFEGRGRLHRVRLLPFSTFLMLSTVILSRRFGEPGAARLLFGVLYVLGVLGSILWYTLRRHDIRVDERGLSRDGALVLERDQMAGAVRAPDGRSVVMHRKRSSLWSTPWTAQLSSEASTVALLEAVGAPPERPLVDVMVTYAELDPGRVVVSVLLVAGLLGGAAGLLTPAWAIAFGLLVLLGLGAMGVAALHVWITVGRDGIWLARRLFASRFVSFADLKGVEIGPRHFSLWLRSEERLRFVDHTGGWLGARIDAARAAFDGPRPPTPREAELAPKGRTAAQWLGDLRSLATRDDYRHASVDPDELRAIVEDPAAPAEARVGAAVVLASPHAVEERSRIGVASEACAEPRLRVALRRIAEGSEGEERARHLADFVASQGSSSPR